jgi:hypothetical protein
MWLLLILSAGGALLVLWLAARLSPRERAARGLLAATLAEMEARRLQERLQVERELADRYYDAAFAARERGALQEAERLLDLAFAATDRSAHTLRQLLAVMAVLWPAVAKGTAVARRRLLLFGLRVRLTMTTLYLRDARRRMVRRWNAVRHAETIRLLTEDLPAVFEEPLDILAALFDHLPPRLAKWTDLREAWRRRPEATALTLRVALFFVLLLAWHLVRLSRPM